jgi:glycosyltransferase involved in cell wall biosynthesis
MKIALVFDQLLTTAGAERIFQYMIEEFQDADVYTISYNPDTTWPALRNYKINTNWVNVLIKNHNRYKLFYPILSYIMKYWDFSDYDLILSSSGTLVKHISRFNCPHICYCFIPTRAIWDTNTYFSDHGLKQRMFKNLLPHFQHQDISSSKRVTKYITISEYSRRAIAKIYNREADILFCPIDFDNFSRGALEKKENHYLIVSRLERWKRLEYAIEAFNQLGYPLRIIGSGNDAHLLKSMAKDNIKFVGNVDDNELAIEYGRAKAVIFTPELEYGLVPIEANAAGTPVIAYGRGAINETMISLGQNKTPTAVFFYEQTAESLIEAIKIFETCEFKSDDLVSHASKWSIAPFKKKIREYVESVIRTL